MFRVEMMFKSFLVLEVLHNWNTSLKTMLLSNMDIMTMSMSESQKTTISAAVLVRVLGLICYVRLHNLDSF